MLCIALLPFSAPPLLFAESGISYRVSIRGVVDNELKGLLESVSDTVTLRDRPPASLRLLQRRAERDISAFVRALKSMGFYASRVTLELDEKAVPPEILFDVIPGPLYRIRQVEINLPHKEGAQYPRPAPGIVGLASGHPARSRDILEGGKILARWYEGRGYPFTASDRPKILLNHDNQTAMVILGVDPGKKALFGETYFRGLESVDEDFLRRKLPWEKGELYSVDRLEKGQRALGDLGLFAMVRVTAGESLDGKGLLPIWVTVSEGKHRSIGAGVGYKTDEGPGGNVSWEHRNLFHQGERLKLSATGSSSSAAVEGAFRKPSFLRGDQSLSLSLRLADDKPDAYASRNITSSAFLDRRISGGLTIGGGLAFKASRIEQGGTEERFCLISFPLYLDMDASNDLLDPTRGGRLGMQIVPFWGVSGGDQNFLKGRASYRHYIQVSASPPLTLAGKLTLGAIAGAGRDDIPGDERFYAGGGGSIRGYAYQSVGPLSSGNPIGGKVLLEFSLETRVKVTERLGLVGFLDGGGAFTDSILDSKEDLLWGAGIGFRYSTPLGPLRLDVGFPLNRREGIDDSFQMYVSLGQAF